MKVLYCSDLHVDMPDTLKEKFKQQFDRLYSEGFFDTLLIAGDITNNYNKSVSYLDYLNRHYPTKALLGNHDLYNTKQNILEVLEDFSKMEFCLTTNPIVSEDSKTIILGDMGWHDYTCYMGRRYYEERVSNYDFYRLNKGNYSNDELVSIFRDKLTNLLVDARDKGYTEIIPVSHYAPHPILTRDRHDPISNMFGNTYSHKLYQLFKVKRAIYGHTHDRGIKEIDGIKYHANSIGYLEEFKYYSHINKGETDREDSVILNNLRTIKI